MMNQGLEVADMSEALRGNQLYPKVKEALVEVESRVQGDLSLEREGATAEISRIIGEFPRNGDPFLTLCPPLPLDSKVFLMLQKAPGFTVWALKTPIGDLRATVIWFSESDS